MRGNMVRGSSRRGEALLAGLLRCGHCVRKLHIAYSGSDGNTARYHCKGAAINHGSLQRCISFGSLRVEQAVAAQVLSALRPLGIQAAVHAIEERALDGQTKRRQIELALEQARFEASRAQRQFDTVDPANRLVAAKLERRWNERLTQIASRQAELDGFDTQATGPAVTAARGTASTRGRSTARMVRPGSRQREVRKRILSSVIKEIVVRVAEVEVQLVIHWQGGDHTLERCAEVTDDAAMEAAGRQRPAK